MSTPEPAVSADLEQVKALGVTALGVGNQCRDGLTALEADVREVLEGWTGNNSDAFSAGWDEFHQGAIEVWDALVELASKLGVTADTLCTTDQSSATGISLNMS